MDEVDHEQAVLDEVIFDRYQNVKTHLYSDFQKEENWNIDWGKEFMTYNGSKATNISPC
jgi:hypothetical protein